MNEKKNCKLYTVPTRDYIRTITVFSDHMPKLFLYPYIYIIKSKITKIENSEENSKQKVLNQIAKSNEKTHHTNDTY